ncbi:MAG: LamG domain-containing protein [Planctomycetota bacterium]
MTRFFTTASLIAVSLTTAQASADLVDHWTFDSADRSGNTAFDTAGLNVNNAVAPDTAAYTTGFLGDGAASFTTAGDSIFNVASIELSNATGITISMWIKNEGAQETNSSNSDNDIGIFVSRDTMAQRATTTFNNQFWGLGLERDNGEIDFTVRGDSTGTTRAENVSESFLSDWTHIAYTWQRNGPTANNTADDPTAVYINGALAQAGTVNADTYVSGSWNLGHDPNNSGRDYNGLVDDLAIFDEALTAPEIASLYNDGLNGLNAAGVPEPGSLALLGLGGLLIARRRRG